MQDLVNQLKKNGYIKTGRVEATMLSVDRCKYSKFKPYQDAPQPTDYGGTIFAPSTHAYVLEQLNDHLQEGCNVLHIGSGTGYLTVCMALMTGPSGTVIGIEHIPELVDQATDVIKEDHPGLIQSGRIKFIEEDGRKGYAEDGPYDVIYVGAAIPKIPNELTNQLKVGGRMIVPEGLPAIPQVLKQVDKLSNGSITETQLMNVFYRSLTDTDSQLAGKR